MLRILLSVVLLVVGLSGVAQKSTERKDFRLLFYNVENLFDTRNNLETQDDEFTPRGSKYWSRERYNTKLRNTAKAISACSDGGVLPCFVALAEIENRAVLNDLTTKTSLGEGSYSIIQQDSQDPRGIDVALLYNSERFTPTDTLFIPFKELQSRDLLCVSGVLDGADTLHLIVAHFPSMRGGEKQSEWKRVLVAKAARGVVDSLYNIDADANIVLCGDLNCEAGTNPMTVMRAVEYNGINVPGSLYDLAFPYKERGGKGSYCYMGKWQTIDHIVTSPAIMSGKNGYKISDKGMIICDKSFLLEENKKQFGWQPLPTYRGMYYKGGYSDHLPIYADFIAF